MKVIPRKIDVTKCSACGRDHVDMWVYRCHAETRDVYFYCPMNRKIVDVKAMSWE